MTSPQKSSPSPPAPLSKRSKPKSRANQGRIIKSKTAKVSAEKDFNVKKSSRASSSFKVDNGDRESGWWWNLPIYKTRLFYRLPLPSTSIKPSLIQTTKRHQQMPINKSKQLQQNIDYYLGARIKLNVAYTPFIYTFDYLEFNPLIAVKLYYVFCNAGGGDSTAVAGRLRRAKVKAKKEKALKDGNDARARAAKVNADGDGNGEDEAEEVQVIAEIEIEAEDEIANAKTTAEAGCISLIDWLMFLDVERTFFNEKIFTLFSPPFSSTPTLTFPSFIMLIYNFCSATSDDLINLAFFLYSDSSSTNGTVEDGVLNLKEVEHLISSLYGKDHNSVDTNHESYTIKSQLIAMCTGTNTGIDIEKFTDYVKSHMKLLEPVFLFKKRLVSMCMGRRFWRRCKVKRRKLFGDASWIMVHDKLKVVAARQIEITEFEVREEVRVEEERLRLINEEAEKKIETTEVIDYFADEDEEEKGKKGPKYKLTKKLREKERYEVLSATFEKVNLTMMKAINAKIIKAKLGSEYKRIPSMAEIYSSKNGSEKLSYGKLKELECLKEDMKTTYVLREEVSVNLQRIEDGKVKTRGLFEYVV